MSKIILIVAFLFSKSLRKQADYYEEIWSE